MSTYVIAAREALAEVSADVSGIGSAITATHAVAATSTTRIVPAAHHEVSVAVAASFGGYGRQYQALSVWAGLLHQRFAQAFTAAAGGYAAAEAANASRLPVPSTAIPSFPVGLAGNVGGFTVPSVNIPAFPLCPLNGSVGGVSIPEIGLQLGVTGRIGEIGDHCFAIPRFPISIGLLGFGGGSFSAYKPPE